MHEVLVNRLGGLSLPRKSVVRLTDRPGMTLDVYRGRKTTMQHLYYFIHIRVYAVAHHIGLAVLSNIQHPSVKVFNLWNTVSGKLFCKSV